MEGAALGHYVTPKQWVAWKYLDGKFCPLHKLTTRLAPMPHQEIGRN